MSKGEIVTSKGDGFYTVSLKYALDRVQQENAKNNIRIAELAVNIADKKADVIQSEALVAQAARDIDFLIQAYREDVVANTDKMKKLQAILIQKGGDLSRLRYERDLLVAENLSLLKRRTQIGRMPEEKLINAWCGDYTEYLSGEVGLVDVNDEGGNYTLIQPGFEGAAAYSASRDGQLMPREAQSGAQVWLNAALLPGVQKWQPRYRIGTVSAINIDACTVELDNAESSAQSLNINKKSTFTDVPIVYMDCNGLAFEDGDRVLVRFTQSGPLVVGFEKNPRQCGLDVYLLVVDISGSRGIFRLSPDMREIKDSFYENSQNLTDFSITDGHFLIITAQRSSLQDNDEFLDSTITFTKSGTSFYTAYDDPGFNRRQTAGANSTGFLAYLIDGAALVGYVEKYDTDGNFIERFDATTPDLDPSNFNLYNVPANDESAMFGAATIGADTGGGDWATSQTSLITGNRERLYTQFQTQGNESFITRNRIYIMQSRVSSQSNVDIYSASGSPVGSWQLADTGGIEPQDQIVVTRSRGYVFLSAIPTAINNARCEVQVYSRDGDQFSYIETVDLTALHGFNFVFKATPDMKDLLAKDA